MEDKITPAGRVILYKKDEERVPNIKKDSDSVGCKEIGKTLAVHQYDSVHLCHGHASFGTNGLSVGNIKDRTLLGMVKEARRDLLFWRIHVYGTINILDKVGSKHNATTICEACVEIFTGSRSRTLKYLMDNKNEIFVNEILLSWDFVKGANSILSLNKKSAQTSEFD